MENEYEIQFNPENGEPEQPPVQQEPVENMEEPVQQEQVETVEEPVQEEMVQECEETEQELPQEKVSPFADSPYVMAAQPQMPKKKKKSGVGKFFKRLVAAVLVLALIASAVFAVSYYWQSQTEVLLKQIEQMEQKLQDMQEQINDKSFTGNGNSVSGTPNIGTDGSLTPGQVYAKAVNSVVGISSYVGQSTQASSTGSGFIISKDGYILTNCHVIDGATKITVTTHSSKVYGATLIGSDATNDIALLKITAENLKEVALGKSSDLIVGDMVVAIGNPLGELTATLTVGYISAKDREVSTDGTIINMLQTDAAINPGNSGGPLFNMKGEVIGITTAKYSGTTNSGASLEGLGFAIPIDDVKEIVQQIQEQGYVSSAYLGVYVQDSYDGIGVYVQSTEPGFCAERAGIRGGDYIIALGDYDVHSIAELTKILRNFKPGDVTTVTVFRGRQVLQLRIVLDAKPAPTG